MQTITLEILNLLCFKTKFTDIIYTIQNMIIYMLTEAIAHVNLWLFSHVALF